MSLATLALASGEVVGLFDRLVGLIEWLSLLRYRAADRDPQCSNFLFG